MANIKNVKFGIWIVLLLFISLNSQAQEQQACCEQTTDGSLCIYTDQSYCNPNFNMDYQTCEQTTYCSDLVHCQVASTGQCLASITRQECLRYGDVELFDVDQYDYDDVCGKTCCIFGDSCLYKNEDECRALGDVYTAYTPVMTDVENEIACRNLCLNQEQGCCVEDNRYRYTSGDTCEGEFYPLQYCSVLNPQACSPQTRKGCFDNDVYSFDSCGQREDLVLDCGSDSICEEDGEDAICKSLDCADTYDGMDNTHDPRLGGLRYHGESWCVYQGPVGNYLDRPGTIHSKYSCINGEEVFLPCEDYRGEVCVQGEVGGRSFAD